MADAIKSDFKVDVLIYPEGDHFLAHCLQFDLAEAGATRGEAVEALMGVIKAHVEWALEDDDMEHLLHAAPKALWVCYWQTPPSGFREVAIESPKGASAVPLVRLSTAERPDTSTCDTEMR